MIPVRFSCSINSLKKLAVLVCSVLVLCSASFASEWGGLVSSRFSPVIPSFAEITGDSLSFQQSNDIYVWMNSAINTKKTLFFDVELKYEFGWNYASSKESFFHFLDADLLKFSGQTEIGETSLSFALVRFPVSDSTGVVFSQLSDGILATAEWPLVTLSGYAGYTGLLNMLDSSGASNVSMIGKDGAVETSSLSFYAPAHPYIPVNLSVQFPAVFGNHTLSLQTNAFFDTKDDFNRYYANLLMTGPLANSFYYTAATTFGSVNFLNVANYTSLNFVLFPSANVAVTFGGEYASGDGQLFFSKFTGFTSRVAYNSFQQPQTSGIIIPMAGVTFTAGESFYTGITGKFVMVMPGTTIEKTAAEVATDLIYNLFSDLQLGLNVNWYFPVGESEDSQKFSASLNVGLSF